MQSMPAHDALDSDVSYDKVSLSEISLSDILNDEHILDDSENSRLFIEILLHILERCVQELCLLRMQWRMWLLCLIVDVYGACMVFRNLAFYRFRAGPRLTQDLGFDILPEWQSYLTDAPLQALQIVLFSACFMCFVPRHRSRSAAYVVNIWRRWGMMIGMGNILRFLTYISTTLPGSAAHCLPSNLNIVKDQPKTISDILFRYTCSHT